MAEGGVVGVDLDLGHDGHHPLRNAHPAQIVLEVLLQGVADGTLGVGAAGVEGDLVQLVGGKVGAPQDEADLGAVAVDDDQVPSLGDEIGDVVGGLGRRLVLVLDRLVGRVLDQRVAPDGDDGAGHGYSIAPSTSDSSAIRITTP